MISLLKRHWRVLTGFIFGLMATIIFSFATPNQQPVTASVPTQNQIQAQSLDFGHPDFYYSHEEPNFYQ
ncbi:hypothetical protein [Nostoc sp. CMAA1605]|uniref:hypothetical protein n=1 Tax=Nostoc sp. CMAA1605 TaxID=2055159 RepID=UPI001F20BA8B|nr:hypothetical protein [Nostoc sp. CMAA1605]MCF4970257.1 hypothetical protein [Nostoc sp. CMAA1605]